MIYNSNIDPIEIMFIVRVVEVVLIELESMVLNPSSSPVLQ
jgi:hypothetical protein